MFLNAKGNSKKKQDDDVICGCIRSDRRAQEKLYKLYYSYAMNQAFKYMLNAEDSKEVVNESFLKVFNNIKKYNREIPFSSWLKTIIRNTAIDYLRKNKKMKMFVSINDDQNSDDKKNQIDTTALIQIIKPEIEIFELLSKIPDIYRVVFMLYEIDGYSHSEIGGILKITESSSRAYLSNAKRLLKELCLKAGYSI